MVRNINLLISFFISLIVATNSYSQKVENTKNEDIDMFESINLSLQEKPKFYIGFDNKNSFISNRSGWFIGAKVGLEYNKIFRYGIGFYGLYNKTYAKYINGIKKSEEYLSFNYASIFAEYIFKSSKKYEYSLPINLGFGYSWLGDFQTSAERQFVILYEAQLNGLYYPISFFGVGAGVGYRIMLLNNKKIDEQFSAPIYNIKFKIVFGEIFNL